LIRLVEPCRELRVIALDKGKDRPSTTHAHVPAQGTMGFAQDISWRVLPPVAARFVLVGGWTAPACSERQVISCTPLAEISVTATAFPRGALSKRLQGECLEVPRDRLDRSASGAALGARWLRPAPRAAMAEIDAFAQGLA